jgi:DNA-binding transcriptional MerR regulator
MYDLQNISTLTGLPIRTIRYYIQKNLVDKPEGARKTASYTQQHLEQLMTVKRLSESGLSLAAIAKVMNGTQINNVHPSDMQPGQVRAVSFVHISPGVELSIDPLQCNLTQAQLRELSEHIIHTVNHFNKES